MKIRTSTSELTGRVNQLSLTQTEFMDEKILTLLDRVFTSGGRMHVIIDDEHVGTIEYPEKGPDNHSVDEEEGQ